MIFLFKDCFILIICILLNVYCNDSIEDESLDFYSDSMHKKSRFKVEFDFERATILIVILLLLLFLPVWLICFLSRSASRLHWSSYDYFHRKQESLKKRFEATNKTPVNVYDDKDDDDRIILAKLQQKMNNLKQSMKSDTLVSENDSEKESTIEISAKDLNVKSRFVKKNVSIKRKSAKDIKVQEKVMTTNKNVKRHNIESDQKKTLEEFTSLE